MKVQSSESWSNSSSTNTNKNKVLLVNFKEFWVFQGTSSNENVCLSMVKLTSCADEYVWYEKTIIPISKKSEMEAGQTHGCTNQKPFRALTDASNDTLHVYWIQMDEQPHRNWFLFPTSTIDDFNLSQLNPPNDNNKSTFNFITKNFVLCGGEKIDKFELWRPPNWKLFSSDFYIQNFSGKIPSVHNFIYNILNILKYFTFKLGVPSKEKLQIKYLQHMLITQ